MKPLTVLQEAIYTATRIDTDEQNVRHVLLWRDRWILHRASIKVLYHHFGNLGDTDGRT